MEVEGFSLPNGGANGDVETAFTIETETANRARVETALDGLELLDDFSSALLRSTGDAASGKAGSQGGDGVYLFAQSSFYRGDEMKDLGKSLELQQLCGFDSSKLTDLSEVISL